MNANKRRSKQIAFCYLRLFAFIGGSSFLYFLGALGVLGGCLSPARLPILAPQLLRNPQTLPQARAVVGR
jgi:hypothetical protein